MTEAYTGLAANRGDGVDEAGSGLEKIDTVFDDDLESKSMCLINWSYYIGKPCESRSMGKRTKDVLSTSRPAPAWFN